MPRPKTRETLEDTMTTTRTTLILEATPEVADFLNNQADMVDPNTLVNRLIRDAKKREGLDTVETGRTPPESDNFHKAMEDFLDQDIPSAG
jgi:hypothetical protein